jgi:simple sugar transport system permease protein
MRGTEPWTTRLSTLMSSPEARLAVIAVVVFVVMAALSPDRFLSAQNLTSMAFQFPEFAILALAMTLTMLTGGIDLSVVGIANLSAIVAAMILTSFAGAGATGGDAALWLAVALRPRSRWASVAGLFNGIAIAIFGLPPILATLGSGLIFTGIAVAITGGSAVMGFPAGRRLDRQRAFVRNSGAADPVRAAGAGAFAAC